MALRKVVSILSCCLSLCSLALAQHPFSDRLSLISSLSVRGQDFDKTVLPLTDIKLRGVGAAGELGTGFCLDPACRFIGTNYHVAMIAQPPKIKGEKIVQRYVATGPDDEDATLNSGTYVTPMKYTLARDLAIFELRRPLSNYHGIAFSLEDLQVGQEVDIYTYPKETSNPVRSIVQFHGTFKGETTTGLLAFDYNLSSGKAIRPGASGGLVVDRKTQEIVGILNAVARDGETIALAVPIRSLADFVRKVQPCLAATIFRSSAKDLSPDSADLYPKYLPQSHETLQHRSEESAEIKVLRSKAQILSDSMRDFIAVQTFVWGTEDGRPVVASAYEVRVLDGYQRFREYPNGKKELKDVPLPPLNTAMSPGGEWSELPTMVGTQLRLQIHQAGDVVVNGRQMKIFQYRADPEDAVCRFESIFDFVFFAINKIGTVGCYGEVWTDEDTNILRISEHLELPGKWKDYQSVVTYGWLQRKDESPRLIPITISSQAEYDKKIYWCRGQFMDYQVFGSRVKIVAN